MFSSWGVRLEAVATQAAGPLRSALRCLQAGIPWVNWAFEPALATRACEILLSERFDLVFACSIFSMQHVPHPCPAPVVAMALDSQTRWHRRAWQAHHHPLAWCRMHKMQAMERACYSRATLVTSVAESDAAVLRGLIDPVRVEIVPNGVDLDQFRPSPIAAEPATLAFSGAMEYPPNEEAVRWLVHEVLPLVRRERPDAKLWIIGRSPGPRVQELAAHAGVHVTGRVDDMAAWLNRATLVLSPLLSGTGIKNKVLEGAALAKPMVVTPLSIEDTLFQPDRDLLCASTAEPFARAILDLLNDPTKAGALGAAARQVVEQHYTWEAMSQRLEQLFQEVLA